MSNRKMTNNTENTKNTAYIQWHPAFYSAVQLDFYNTGFEYHFEYPLNTKPLLVDTLIVKNDIPGISNNAAIVSFFKRFNIFEYKSPKDSMNMDAFYKGIGYGCILKSENTRFHNIEASEITITFIRHSYPRELIKELNLEGYKVRKVMNGIFQVSGKLPFDVRIIVTKLLEENMLQWIRSLSHDITLAQYVKLFDKLVFYDKTQNDDLIKLIKSVLKVVHMANSEKINKWKENTTMMTDLADTFYPVFKKDIDDARNEGLSQGLSQGFDIGLAEKGILVYISCKQHGLSDEDAMAIAQITDEQVIEAVKRMNSSTGS